MLSQITHLAGDRRHVRSRALTAAGSVAGVLAFALLVALGARMQLFLPFTPVPLTLQVPFVLLAGAVLGPRRAAASMAAYLAAGVAGLPAFAAGAGPAYLLGPTGGYLLGFVPAAFLVGLLGRRAGASFWRLAAAMLLGAAVIHIAGAAHLSVALGQGPGGALRAGVLPFLGAGLLEIAGAAALAAVWRGRAARPGRSL